MVENFFRFACLHNFAQIHDGDSVADIIYRAKAVAHEKQCEMQLFLQAL